ncbi:MAG: acylneuraminate cytidylyltransferase [gamma proteobacterium endosymbiont of Lamellibrachia anaximandri]|nr:acylneuraminate cytidylyltransferase [gamma proteobacterium endosymbiont of Lamellibrachia anaximandri]
MNTVAAFVPLKLNSRRLPNKNFLRLGNYPLAYHVFNTLLTVHNVDSVFCYTSQPQVLSLLPSNVELLMRPRHLDGDGVKANELFLYAVENIDADVIVLCHATGPFIGADSINEGIQAVLSGNYDCSFAVQKHQTYSWFMDKPLNYDPSNMEQTQDLAPIFCETSGFYIFRKDNYLKTGSRIGETPYMVEVDVRESIDIDEPADFNLASHMFSYNPHVTSYSRDTFFVDLANQSSQHKNISHVSFDLDGVLIDSIELMDESWAHAMNTMDLSYRFSEYKKRIGMPFLEILKSMGVDEKYYTEIEELYNRYSAENIDKIKKFMSINDGLKRLKSVGIKISLVTSKNKDRTSEIMSRHFDENIFETVVTPADIPSERGKPNPDPILLACVQLGVDPYNTIYVGDMEVDREASKRAGTHFVYANWGYGDLTKVKDVWFNCFDDLIEFIVS